MSLPIAPKGVFAPNMTLFNADVSVKVAVLVGPIVIRGWSMSDGTNYVQFFNALIADVTLGTTAPDLVVRNSDLILELPLVWEKGLVIASTTTRAGGTTAAQNVSVFYNAA